MCLLKILYKGWIFVKHLSTMFKNYLPRLVFIFEFHGGLYHVMFCFLFFWWVCWCCCGSCFSLWLYSLSSSAFWYGVMHSLKIFHLMICLKVWFFGMFFSVVGGWLLCLCTYSNLLLGFVYGL